MGRDEKYHPRPRHIYALIFSGRRCYVGQTVSPRRRWAQHRVLWRRHRFTPIVLARIVGTHQDAEEHEYAWRIAAYQRGWRVYGRPGVFVNPTTRATARRWALSRACRWPEGVSPPRTGLLGWMVLGLALVLGWALYWGPLRPLLPWVERLCTWAFAVLGRS